MKHINKIGMMAVAGAMLAAVSCSDYDDFNTAPSAVDPAADKTLWENIASNPELSEFKSVLERLGYDEVLDASHTYTVWAPVNGSIDMNYLNSLSDEKAEKVFLKNMIANYAHRENDLSDTVIYMLNEKLLKFANKKSAGGMTFDGKRVLANQNNPSVYNYPSVNGLLYMVEAPSDFRYNGYEYIFETAGVADSLMEYVLRYEKRVLDEANSVKGPIRDGVQHYDDSVIIVSNSLIGQTLNSQIENEDSMYTVLIPTDEAWVDAYNRISSYYKYIPTISYQDLSSTQVGFTKGTSGTIMKANVGAVTVNLTTAPADAKLQETGPYWTDSITKKLITQNLIYSDGHKKYNGKLASGIPFTETDTLYSTSRRYLTNLPALDAATVETVRLSNGRARILNAYPFTAENTYAPTIKTRAVGRVLANPSGGTYSTVSYFGVDDSICTLDPEEEGILTYVKADVPEGSNYAPELDFYIPNVLSTTYDIYAVIIPKCFEFEYRDIPEEERKPYTLYFDINYTDASNTQISGRFDGDTIQVGNANVKKVEPFLVAQDKIDTLKLGRLTFPACYVGTGAMPNIKVMHSVSSFLSSYKKKYEQVLRVANIILRPVDVKEEE